MSFVLSEINHDNVVMASDSSETREYPDGRVDFADVDKTLYFGQLNIGISTWGESSCMPGYHLRNGIYREFALFWPTFAGIDETFRTFVKLHYAHLLTGSSDAVRLKAEWLGNWVRQMCFILN